MQRDRRRERGAHRRDARETVQHVPAAPRRERAEARPARRAGAGRARRPRTAARRLGEARPSRRARSAPAPAASSTTVKRGVRELRGQRRREAAQVGLGPAPRRRARGKRVEQTCVERRRARRARCYGCHRAGMGYFDWHEQPGYCRDVTRHFARGAELLDVGCGTGWLAEHFDDYTGLDGSPEAVRPPPSSGRQRCPAATSTEPLPFPDASFDAVVMKDLLEHVERPGRASSARRAACCARAGSCSPPPPTRSAGSGTTTPTGGRSRRKSLPPAVRRPGLRGRARRLRVGHAGDEHRRPLGRRYRRPPRCVAAAWLPVVRRNVWLVARR